jgi:hypothetical protein
VRIRFNSKWSSTKSKDKKYLSILDMI